MSNNTENTNPRLFDIAIDLSLVMAWLYATGWSYSWRYFEHFSLGLLPLDIPPQRFVMNGFIVLKDWWYLIIVCIILRISLKSSNEICSYIRLKLEQLRHKELLKVTIVMLFFWLGGVLADESADDYIYEQQAAGFTNFPFVKIWSKQYKSQNVKLNQIYKNLREQNYRLLLQSKTNVYLIKEYRNDGIKPLPIVTILSLSEIEALKVIPVELEY